jgi:anti-anti-sigma factor
MEPRRRRRQVGGRAVEIEIDGRTIIPAGDLDESTVGAVRQAITDTAAGGPVVLDLSRLTHLASIGISLLVATMRRLGDDGFRVEAVPGSRVAQVLDMFRLPYVPRAADQG